MDRLRAGSPVYNRQRSGTSTASSSPSMSPAHPSHSRSSSAAGAGMSNVRRTQNYAAKAAAQRLAQVMASQNNNHDNDDDDDDDLPLAPRFSSYAGPSRSTRSPSPALGRTMNEHASQVRSTSTGRPSASHRPAPVAKQTTTTMRTVRPSVPSIETTKPRFLKFKRLYT